MQADLEVAEQDELGLALVRDLEHRFAVVGQSSTLRKLGLRPFALPGARDPLAQARERLRYAPTQWRFEKRTS